MLFLHCCNGFPVRDSITAAIAGDSCVWIEGYWRGDLLLPNYGSQPVQAKIVQKDCDIVIYTNSTFHYASEFTGTITDDFIQVIDSATGKIWTTHMKNATEKHLELLDYINNYTDFDELVMVKARDLTYLAGDIDWDNRVDTTDALRGLQICVNAGISQEVQVRADIGQDGRLGLEDIIYVLRQAQDE